MTQTSKKKNRNDHNIEILGQNTFNKVQNSKVLMVGTGGIGCELIKNLVLSGFKDIIMVDFDTIDLSNLNRQFLFQKKHIKKSKAHVAKEAALLFNDQVKIQSFNDSIFDEKFNLNWFKNFDIIFNALDNLPARRHVNLMAMAANVPLVESGTAGYLGQVTVHKKNLYECFDCEPKPTPKTFPVCTIRSTPST
ncbi:E1 ubiquitin-activating protein uba2, partial [Clydaea vesicula]